MRISSNDVYTQYICSTQCISCLLYTTTPTPCRLYTTPTLCLPHTEQSSTSGSTTNSFLRLNSLDTPLSSMIAALHCAMPRTTSFRLPTSLIRLVGVGVEQRHFPLPASYLHSQPFIFHNFYLGQQNTSHLLMLLSLHQK